MNTYRKFSRRDFLKLIKTSALSLTTLGILGYVYSSEIEMSWLDITHVTLKLRRLHPAFHGIRVTQLSDFHTGHWLNKERLEQVLNLALAEKPDCFFLTGDFVDKYPNEMSPEESLATLSGSFARLSALCPTMAVLGNHDHLVSATAVQAALSGAGVIVLRNSVTTLKRDGHELHIAGVDDLREKADRFDEVLTQLPERDAAILLVHEPDFADTSAATGRFDLQLSGHTHGGQIVLPFLGPPYLPSWGRKYSSGLYNVQDMWVYTNRGIGVTSVTVRFNCRPEITIFTLETA